MKGLTRTFAVLAAASLLLGAFAAGPADAKKRKKKKAVPACAAYVPGEAGAEAPIAIVTDAATADAPVSVTLTAAEGVGVGGVFEDLIGHAYHNVQVDTAATSASLHVRLEMPAYEDYDLYVRDETGAEIARAAGFNPEPTVYNDTDAGGHTEKGAEVIDGVATNDCGGYTVEAATASGMGGDLTLKFWLGE
jgi:hypothetical protein